MQDVENLMDPLPTNRSQAQVPASSDYKININSHLQFFQNSVLLCHFGFLTVDWRQCLIFFGMGLQFCEFIYFFLIKE